MILPELAEIATSILSVASEQDITVVHSFHITKSGVSVLEAGTMVEATLAQVSELRVSLLEAGTLVVAMLTRETELRL
jgi:hypothetical protein